MGLNEMGGGELGGGFKSEQNGENFYKGGGRSGWDLTDCSFGYILSF
ncbi:hypothetical protein [Campylobacter lanienae]|nr:hypothetical protein [Campylobacter lanienae]MDY6135278.1 hypothetical protein [Campylobacter lanienae]